MNVAVVGSRSFDNYELMTETLKDINIDTIISGGAMGADKFAELYAKENNLPLIIIKADWTIGKKAGPLRNTEIVKMSDIVVAFWDGESNGTRDSIRKAKRLKKDLIIVKY